MTKIPGNSSEKEGALSVILPEQKARNTNSSK